MLTHRPYEKSDLATICTFFQNEQELFFFYPKADYPLTPIQLQAAIDQRHDATVVARGDEVVAFADFYHKDHGICCIGNVVVAPLARGAGVAEYLIRTMIHLAVGKHAATEVQVACFNQNTAGLLLYRKIGFVPFEIEERLSPKGARTALIRMKLIVG